MRIKSILTRAVTPGPIKLASEAERQLGFKLVVGFQQAIRKAVGLLSPKEVADHAYDIAQSFSKLYAQYPIADDPSRVALAQVVLTQLECCLHLLGIQVVERM